MEKLTKAELDYLIKLVESEDSNDWSRAVIDLDANLHPDSLRKSFNVGRYCGYNVAKYYKDLIESEYFTDEEFIRLESLRDEIYKERVKLQDSNREKRKYLREDSRFESLIEVYKDTCEFSDKIVVNEYKKVDKTKDKKYAVTSWSDWHAGLKIDNQFNYYDIDTMIERATIIKDKVIANCEKQNVTDLIIEINGDMLDGGIHISSRVEQEEGVIQQVVIVTDLLIKLINDMKPYFNSIKIYTTLGNHARLTPNKHDSVTKENFETLIPIRLRDNLKDVSVIDSKGLDFLMYKIEDKVICLSHGQNDKISTVISDFTNMFKIVPNEIHLGHTHSYKDINDCDIYVSVNGCLDGSDEYAVTLRKITKPSQNLIIYDEDRWISALKAE